MSIDYYPPGTFGSDWAVERADGKPLEKWVQRVNDKEGWYEYKTKHITQEVRFSDGTEIPSFEFDKIVHVKADINIYYTGQNPEYLKRFGKKI